MALTTVQLGMQGSPQFYAFKNRIINGAMVIDQRNNGASVTATTSFPYCVDRWITTASVNSKFTVQQNANSITSPSGFANYIGITSSSAYSVAAGDYFYVGQKIEGYNMSDLAWGTASGKTVTVSFWVQSSLTGSFGAAIQNAAGSQNYPFSYTISSANTWTFVTTTIPAPNVGSTWSTNNATGLVLVLSVGVGTTYSGTANAWTSSSFIFQPTGSVSLVGTSGATLYITGVQLEVGSSATSFDYRPYGTELNLCQRYYEYGNTWAGGRYSDGYAIMNGVFKVTKRTAPTTTYTVVAGGTVTSNQNTIDSVQFYSSAGTSTVSSVTWFSTAEL